MSENPRLRRLQSDFARLQKLVAQSNMIRIVATEGSPPTRYLLEFNCRGIAAVQGETPTYADVHRVEIYLGGDYPSAQPQMKWQTPIYHPNIGAGGGVCIGKWWASKGLDELIYMLIEMVQYKNYAADDALNFEAAQWAKRHRSLFPVDKREIRVYGDGLFDNIRIGGGDSALMDSIRIGEDPGPRSGQEFEIRIL